MIITDKFIFIHLHKSGGTFVNNFINKFFPEARPVVYHLPGQYIPEDFKHLPSFGLVRNPWSYYVSWYTFQSGMPSPNIVFRVASDNGKLDFNETIQNLLSLSNNPTKIQAIAEELPITFRNAGINLTKQCIKSIEGSGMGFYSFLYNRMFSEVNNIQIGKMESLRDELISFLQTTGVTISKEMQEHINLSPKLNITRHKSNMEIYDQKTADMVNNADSLIINKHGYTF